MATANSMNLTDGLDGLATGVSILILCGYLIFSLDGEFYWTIIPLLGILAGFLWVNAYPAQLFLGDVGAFALGGVVAAIALVSGTALILPLLAGLLVVESGSVILQVAYFKLTGRRIFKISPFHHHFEHTTGIDYAYLLPKLEWAEPKITIRLWILQVLFVGLAIIAARV
jgi:phospho-N-acetylmuramoyl-pentapeptide-transferase